MTLPASGSSISMSQINVELGRASGTLISLDTAENGGYVAINTNSPSQPSPSNPAAMSEWYSYNHTYTPPSSCTNYSVGYNASSSGTACSNFLGGVTISVGVIGTSLANATFLYRSCGILTARAAGWYSADGVSRYWNGSSFTSSVPCTL